MTTSIYKEGYFKNVNTESEIPKEIQIKLMNGNAQFIMDISNHLQINSYSIAALAIQLCHYFFYKRSYLHYDRFIIAASCYLLASKIRDMDPKIKRICFAFHKIVSKAYEQPTLPTFDDALLLKLQEQICSQEMVVLKTIGFSFEVRTPYDFLDSVYRKYYDSGAEKKREELFYMAKIILLDYHRTQACLVFKPIVLTLAALVTASFTMEKDIVPQEFLLGFVEKNTLNLSQFQGKKRLQIERELKDNPALISEEIKQAAYDKWLLQVAAENKQEFTAVHIIDCINMMSDLFTTIPPVVKLNYNDNNALKTQQVQVKLENNNNSAQIQNQQQFEKTQEDMQKLIEVEVEGQEKEAGFSPIKKEDAQFTQYQIKEEMTQYNTIDSDKH